MDTFTVQAGLERLDEFGHQLFPVLFSGLELVGDEAVLFRLGVFEIDVLHFPFHVVQAQLVRQGNVQHEGLQDFGFPAGLGEYLEAAHHFQAVGQLEHGHAGVGRILDDELFVILGLQAGVLGLDGGNAVETVHQSADGRAPFGLLYLHAGHAAGFVQVNGGDALLGEADLPVHDVGHGVGVADEGRSVVAGAVLEGFYRRGAGFFNEGRGDHRDF